MARIVRIESVIIFIYCERSGIGVVPWCLRLILECISQPRARLGNLALHNETIGVIDQLNAMHLGQPAVDPDDNVGSAVLQAVLLSTSILDRGSLGLRLSDRLRNSFNG